METTNQFGSFQYDIHAEILVSFSLYVLSNWIVFSIWIDFRYFWIEPEKQQQQISIFLDFCHQVGGVV